MFLEDEMNVYCISRSASRTYGSILNFETGEFTPLLKENEIIPAYSDSSWKNVDEMRSLRKKLGVEAPGHCYAVYRYDSRFPHEADEIKAAMQEAGFPNVHMVADVDAVMACYQRESGVMERVQDDKGAIAVSIRSDQGPKTTLSITLCRKGLKETSSVELSGSDEMPACDVCEAFFKNIRGRWGEVSTVMYYGYHVLSDELLCYLGNSFPEAEICATWAETEESGRRNMQRGLEHLLPNLERSRSIIHGWKRCIDTANTAENEITKNLINHLDDVFCDSILPFLKNLSDAGQSVYEVLAEWMERKKAADSSGKLRILDKSMLIPRMKVRIAENLQFKKCFLAENTLPIAAKRCIEAVRCDMAIPDLLISEDEILKILPAMFDSVFSEATQAILEEKLDQWWGNRFVSFEDGFFSNRRRQIKSLEDVFKTNRFECHKSTFFELRAKVIDPWELRFRFISGILGAMRESLRRDLLRQFSPITLEYVRIPELAEIPDKDQLNEACEGGLDASFSGSFETTIIPIGKTIICPLGDDDDFDDPDTIDDGNPYGPYSEGYERGL